MARHVFFSFHYKNDVWRANQVRNSWVTHGKTAAGFIDSSEFEKVKRGGDEAVKRWIDSQLIGTSVTVVLIGSETSNREYVRYELKRSYERGNAIIGVHISNLRDMEGQKSQRGDAIFGELGKDVFGNPVYFYSIAKEYDYVNDGGYNNLGSWIEQAAKSKGK
jgi:hypothetical protein